MHIGTARTALFNWLYARHRGGKYLLRVEDTDRERSTDASVQVIFEGLAWLGLQPDEPPVFQFARADRHREVVAGLLAAGRAYRCWMSVEDLSAERERARAGGRAIRSPWRDRQAEGDDAAPHVIRFKGPLEGETIVEDMVKGQVVFANRELDDLVLLRSDGAPTYNLAVVVDDHDMGVTHVIRGDDHLSNAARQTLIYQALDWPLPAFAHLPMIHGPDGAKLSKRHGARAVSEFAEMGYLPEAMRNYLARLGWGHGDAEIFSDAEAIAWFDVADVVRAPARLDWAKLGHLNNHYIRAADDERLAGLVEAHLRRLRTPASAEASGRLPAAIAAVKDGARTIPELAGLVGFALVSRPFEPNETAAAAFTPAALDLLSRLRGPLSQAGEWRAEALAAVLRDFAKTQGVGLGAFGQALRAALSGGAAAPDLAGALAALGRPESLARLDQTLSRIRQAP